MESTNLQFKINNLKDVLANFSNEDRRMIGVTIIRENSSDNWLFNTEVNITSIVPVVTKALQTEIAQLESELAPILAQEQEEERIRLEQEAIAEAEALAELERIRLEKEQAVLKSQQDAEAVALKLGIDLSTLKSVIEILK